MEVTLRAFLRAITANTLSLMSGAASVPFTALAVFAPTDWQKAIFGLLAICGVLFATYMVWRAERERANTLHNETGELRRSLAAAIPELEMQVENVLYGGQWLSRPGVATAML